MGRTKYINIYSDKILFAFIYITVHEKRIYTKWKQQNVQLDGKLKN